MIHQKTNKNLKTFTSLSQLMSKIFQTDMTPDQVSKFINKSIFLQIPNFKILNFLNCINLLVFAKKY